MKIKDGFVIKAIGDSHIVVPLGHQIGEFGAIIKLNDSSAFLWNLLSDEKQIDELVDALTKNYDVDNDRAFADVNAFVDKLKEHDLLV